MATTLRLLFLTPKQQLTVSPIRKVKSWGNVSAKRNKCLDRNRCIAVRRLDFSKKESCRTTSAKLPEIRINDTSVSTQVLAMQLSFYDIIEIQFQRTHTYFIISTPEKRNLLKRGLQNTNIYHVIGTGSFGTVIEAKYKGMMSSISKGNIVNYYVFLGENVAVKITKPKSFSDIPERYMLNLAHENIIKTRDVICGSNYAHCVIIMEYIENTISLDCVLNNNSWVNTSSAILKIAIDVTNGLRYLHQNNLMHLDVKPANVLMCPTGLCKLCDFGSCIKINSDKNLKYQHKVRNARFW